MAIWSGFDRNTYPGDNVMQSLWDNTELFWCGFYLTKRLNWYTHYATVKGMGWGVAPIYTGKQPGTSPKLKHIRALYHKDKAKLQQALWDNGLADGNEAVDQASARSKIPPNTILYFDVEDTFHDLDWFQYYRGWSRAVVDRFYNAGLYTRVGHANWVTAQLMGPLSFNPFDVVLPTVWIAKYNRANPSGVPIPPTDFLTDPLPAPNPKTVYSGASVWQHIGNFGVKWTDKKGKSHHLSPVDFDTSIYKDPGLGLLSALAT